MATANKPNPTTFTTPTDRELVITRVVDAPRTPVWDVWTAYRTACRTAGIRR
jgi:hypothetical protein